MVKFLVISKISEGVGKEEIAPFVEGETRAAWELTKKGFIRDANYRKDRPGVILICEAKDEEEARKELATLPMIEKGLVGYELIELLPYTGFESLFRKKE